MYNKVKNHSIHIEQMTFDVSLKLINFITSLHVIMGNRNIRQLNICTCTRWVDDYCF